MLTTTELEAMRNVLLETFPDTCTVRRNTRASDGGGGWQDVWADVYTDLPCRVSPAIASRGLDSTIGGTPVARAEWMITTPVDVEIHADDQIIFGTRLFEVRVVGDRSWEISLRIFAVEVL